jgi:hypothetical protein
MPFNQVFGKDVCLHIDCTFVLDDDAYCPFELESTRWHVPGLKCFLIYFTWHMIWVAAGSPSTYQKLSVSIGVTRHPINHMPKTGMCFIVSQQP